MKKVVVTKGCLKGVEGELLFEKEEMYYIRDSAGNNYVIAKENAMAK